MNHEIVTSEKLQRSELQKIWKTFRNNADDVTIKVRSSETEKPIEMYFSGRYFQMSWGNTCTLSALIKNVRWNGDYRSNVDRLIITFFDKASMVFTCERESST